MSITATEGDLTGVRIEKLVYGGEGLARVSGRVVLAPFVLPGETVDLRPAASKPGLLRARLERVVEPATERVSPGCDYFARCGGCHYQHANYEFQLEQKQAILREVLRRVGKLDAPADIRLWSGEPWSYRNRSQFHYRHRRLGYLEAGSHKLCPVDRCPISSPRINEALAALSRMTANRRFPEFLREIEVFTNETEVQLNVLASERPIGRPFFDWCRNEVPGYVDGPIDYAAAGFLYRVSPRSFFQVNRWLVSGLLEAAIEGAAGGFGVELYAGVGLFSIPLARRLERLVAVESNSTAARDLTFNAERAGVSIEVAQQPADTFLAQLQEQPDFLLADPPRAGLGKPGVTELLRLRPRSLTIVSCDPATLARDASSLVQGGYVFASLDLVDLFPQTYHLEAVARLVWPD